MAPMMRKRVQAGLLDLQQRFPGKMTLRVSIDHYTAALHDDIRGAGSFDGFKDEVRGRSVAV